MHIKHMSLINCKGCGLKHKRPSCLFNRRKKVTIAHKMSGFKQDEFSTLGIDPTKVPDRGSPEYLAFLEGIVRQKQESITELEEAEADHSAAESFTKAMGTMEAAMRNMMLTTTQLAGAATQQALGPGGSTATSKQEKLSKCRPSHYIGKPFKSLSIREFMLGCLKVLQFRLMEGCDVTNYLKHLIFLFGKVASREYVKEGILMYDHTASEKVLSGECDDWSPVDIEAQASYLSLEYSKLYRDLKEKESRTHAPSGKPYKVKKSGSQGFGNATGSPLYDFPNWPQGVCWCWNAARTCPRTPCGFQHDVCGLCGKEKDHRAINCEIHLKSLGIDPAKAPHFLEPQTSA